MNYSVTWSATALDRLIEILDFIAEDRAITAKKLVDDILERVEILAEMPKLGPVFSKDVDPNIRSLILGKFIVIYQIDDAKKDISIITVRHSRQRRLTIDDLMDMFGLSV